MFCFEYPTPYQKKSIHSDMLLFVHWLEQNGKPKITKIRSSQEQRVLQGKLSTAISRHPFVEHFEDCYKDYFHLTLPTIADTECVSRNYRPFYHSEVYKISIFLKRCAGPLVAPYCTICQKSFDSGTFPIFWFHLSYNCSNPYQLIRENWF